jgi:uncharacterized protein YpmB
MKLIVIYRELDAKVVIIVVIIVVIVVVIIVVIIVVIAKVVKMSPHNSLLDSDTTEDCL